ncbi:MAG TPA: EamA family transporter [Solirubrobacteraceae bacterium]
MTRRAWLAFAAVSVLWGIPYLFIKYAEQGGLTPITLAWGRLTGAAAILLVLAWRSGTLPTLRGRWRWLAAYAFFEVAIPFPMIAVGEQHVASSLTAIIIASVPLIGTVLALRYDHSEKPTPLRAAGLALGFLGVIALVGIDIAGRSGELLGAGAILIAATGYAIGPMILKQRLGGLDPPTLMGGGLLVGALLLTPLAAIDLPSRVPSLGGFGALAVLTLLCTALAFVIMTVLIREAGTSRAMVITYVNPVIALALGMILLSEKPGAGAILGLVLILAGSWLSTTGRLPSVGRFRATARGRGASPVPSTGPGSAAAAAGSVPSQRPIWEAGEKVYEQDVN